MNVRFIQDFEITVSPVETRVFPAGWTGDVDKKIRDAAVKSRKAEDVTVQVSANDDGKTDPATKA